MKLPRCALMLSIVAALAACVEPTPTPTDGLDEPVATTAAALAGPRPSHPVQGPQPVLVLVVRGQPGDYGASDAAILSTARDQLDGFAAFMSRSSYGRAAFTYAIRGIIDLGPGLCAQGDYDAIHLALLRGGVAAVDASVDFATTHQIVVYGVVGCGLGSTGHTRKVWPIATGEGPLDSSVAFIGNAVGEVGFGTLLHEFAHTLGGAHLEPKVCTVAGARVPIVHTNPGTACALAPPYYLSHEPLGFTAQREFAMPRKLFWNWVTLDETITPTVTSTFVINATEGTGPATRAIRIPLAASPSYGAYVVEYRDGTGADAGQTPGVYLYADSNATTTSLADLIEPPPFADPAAFTARPLAVGARYDDPTYPIKITTLGTAGSRALIRVDLGGTCTAGATHACCYSTTAPCDGVMTCNAAGAWGTCVKQCVTNVCLPTVPPPPRSP